MTAICEHFCSCCDGGMYGPGCQANGLCAMCCNATCGCASNTEAD